MAAVPASAPPRVPVDATARPPHVRVLHRPAHDVESRGELERLDPNRRGRALALRRRLRTPRRADRRAAANGRARVPLRRRRRPLRRADHDRADRPAVDLEADPRCRRARRLPSDDRASRAPLRGDRTGGRRQRDRPLRGVRRPACGRARGARARAADRAGVQAGDQRRVRRACSTLLAGRHGPVHEHRAWLLRPGVHARSAGAHPHHALPAPARRADSGRRRHRPGEHPPRARRRRDAVRRRLVDLRPRGLAAGVSPVATRAGVNLERALELAERGRGTTHPNPVVGAVVTRDGEVAGEGWHERKGGPHAEVVALDAAGDRAQGATLYVTMEPCAHHGTTPPCTDAVLRAGIAKVVAGSLDPNPEARGGLDVLRAAGVDVELEDSFEARAQNEAWRTWVSARRPFVTLKLAVTLDGRVTVPGRRWVSGEESRRRVHELRAQVDAVAVGMGTVRADDPQLTARDVGAERQPRRLAFGQGTTELELRSGAIGDELHALAGEGVQSLLLEGGPTLAAAFLRADLVDKLLLFVAPQIAGAGLQFAPELERPVTLARMSAERLGEDVLLSGYVREPS